MEASTVKVIAEICFMPILCLVQCDIQTSTAYDAQLLDSQASLVATDLQIFHRMKKTNLGLGRISKNYAFFVQSAKIHAYWESKMGPSPICVRVHLIRGTEV